MQLQLITLTILVAFLLSFLPQVQAGEIVLPQPEVRAHLSPTYDPLILKGIKVNPNNPFHLEFVLDCGDASVGNRHACSQSKEPTKLIKYFLASLTIPEKDL